MSVKRLSGGCGSGSTMIRINFSCWIRIRIQYVDPDPDPGGQKLTEKLKNKEFSCFEVLYGIKMAKIEEIENHRGHRRLRIHLCFLFRNTGTYKLFL